MSHNSLKSTVLAAVLMIAAPPAFADAPKPDPAKGPVSLPGNVPAYEENYTTLADPASRNTPWSQLKYIPIFANGWMAFGGDIRLRYEDREHLNFGRGNEDEGWDFQQRSRVWADVHFSPHVRAFSEIQSSTTHELDFQPEHPVEENKAELHQAFLELSYPLGGKDKAFLRAGRQEIVMGRGRLIDTRNAPNTRRAYDAVRTQAVSGPWRYGAMYGREVIDETGAFNDRNWNPTWDFFAGHAARKLTGILPGSELELLYIHSERLAAPRNNGDFIGDRNTLSIRLGGKEGQFDYDLEVVGQTGQVRTGDVRAWFVGFEGGYTFKAPWSPRLGARIDIGSGDDDPTDGTVGGYDFLWSRAMTLSPEFGYTNLISAGPTFGFKPTSKLSIDLMAQGLWRTESEDGLYNIGNARFRAASEGQSDYVGVRTVARVEYKYNEFVTLGTYINKTFAGDFLKETGDGEDLLNAVAYTSFHF